MKISIIEPCGYCAGVSRALELIDKKRREYNNIPFYCTGSIVHNSHVDDYLTSQGIVVLKGNKNDELDKIDSGVVAFTAHGTDLKIIQKAKDKGLIVIDCTCPIVEKARGMIIEKLNQGYEVLYIGKNNHPETLAMLSLSNKVHLVEVDGKIPRLDGKVAIINQTTLSIDDLKEIHAKIKNVYQEAIFIDEICNVTRIRQEAINNLDQSVDGLIVVGDSSSNNTTVLYNMAKSKVDSIMINDPSRLNKDWIAKKKHLAIISGTSASNKQVLEIKNAIEKLID